VGGDILQDHPLQEVDSSVDKKGHNDMIS